MTDAGFIIFIICLFVSFVVGFFVGKRNGVKITAKVMKMKGSLVSDYKGILTEYKELKKRL